MHIFVLIINLSSVYVKIMNIDKDTKRLQYIKLIKTINNIKNGTCIYIYIIIYKIKVSLKF